MRDPSRGRNSAPRALAVLVCGLLFLEACDRPQLTGPSGARSTVENAAPNAWAVAAPDEERDFVELATKVPSSAGFHLDKHGNLVVNVRDAADGPAGVAIVRALLNEQRVRSHLGRTTQVSFRTVRYTYRDLSRWREQLFQELFLALDAVQTLDLDEVQNRLLIGIVDDAASDVEQEIRNSLRDWKIDSGAVTLVREARRRLTSASAPRSRINAGNTMEVLPITLTGTFERPPGGVDVYMSHTIRNDGPGQCTIGFAARQGSTPGFVTATHCTEQWGSLDLTTMHQGSDASGRRLVGSEFLDPFRYECGIHLCRASDASFFRTATGIVPNVGLLARTKTRNSGGSGGAWGSLEIDPERPYFIIVSEDNGYAPAGLQVNKMGRTSGWTWGTITNTCIDQKWWKTPAGAFVTRCAYEADIRSDGGDSGGPVFQWDFGNEVALLGTIVGESGSRTAFSKFSRIVSDLGPLTVTRGDSLPATTPSGYVNASQNPVVTWSAVSGATEYAVYREYEETYGYDEWGNPQLVRHYEQVGITAGTSFTDLYKTVTAYVGTGYPYAVTEVGYYVKAYSKTDKSPVSVGARFAW